MLVALRTKFNIQEKCDSFTQQPITRDVLDSLNIFLYLQNALQNIEGHEY